MCTHVPLVRHCAPVHPNCGIACMAGHGMVGQQTYLRVKEEQPTFAAVQRSTRGICIIWSEQRRPSNPVSAIGPSESLRYAHLQKAPFATDVTAQIF